MLIKQDKKTRQRIIHTQPELYRLFKYTKEPYTNSKGETFTQYYTNRAVTLDSTIYECITHKGPSTSILETSVTKWRPIGMASDINRYKQDLISNGWKLQKPWVAGSHSKHNHLSRIDKMVEHDPQFLKRLEKRIEKVESLKQTDPILSPIVSIPAALQAPIIKSPEPLPSFIKGSYWDTDKPMQDLRLKEIDEQILRLQEERKRLLKKG